MKPTWKIGIVIGIIFMIVLGTFFYMAYTSSFEDEKIFYDEAGNLLFSFNVDGSLITLTVYQDITYESYTYFGPSRTTAIEIDHDNTIVTSPYSNTIDMSEFRGGIYDRGEGALGIKLIYNGNEYSYWFWE